MWEMTSWSGRRDDFLGVEADLESKPTLAPPWTHTPPLDESPNLHVGRARLGAG
jgi:hypothetical protein